jgi:hypothetical protein
MPIEAEPIVAEAEALPIVPPSDMEIVRYSLELIPDSKLPIEPGGITILRGRNSLVLRPDRLILNVPGFNLLHLSTKGEPLLEGEIPSEYFAPTSYGSRMQFATLQPAQEIVLAAVNRNKEALTLYGQVMGHSLREITPEMAAERAERAKHFDWWYCEHGWTSESDEECEASVEFDMRKGEPKGWTTKPTYVGDNVVHFCPTHST